MESKGKLASSVMETENPAMVSPFSDLLSSSVAAGATSAVNAFPFSSCFDMSVDFPDSGKSSLGFMDLLGAHQDLGPNSLFDFPLEYVEGRGPQLIDHQLQYSTHAAPETPDTTAGNPPATPNTSSISSSSNEALADEQQPKRAPDDDDQDDSTKKVYVRFFFLSSSTAHFFLYTFPGATSK